MNAFTWGRSALGKKARSPRWWGRAVDSLPKLYLNLLEPRTWTKEKAEQWIQRIPSKCPFEKQLWYGEKLVLYIPALCSLNPLSTQLYSIRVKAQSFLASLDLD